MNDFRPTSDQTLLRNGFKELLGGVMTESRRRAALDGPTFDRDLWREIASGGWLEAGVSGDLDDVSPTLTLALLSEEVGANLVPAPVTLTAALVVPLLTHAPALDVDLAAVLAGESLVTIALPDGGSPAAPRWSGIRVVDQADRRLRVTGRATSVPLAAFAEWLLVPIMRADGTLVVGALARDQDGVCLADAQELDFVRPTATVEVDGAWIEESAQLADGKDLREIVRDQLLRYLVCIDCESVGAAESVIKGTVAYVRERRQFGVPIGSFQAIKHHLADAYSDMEFARGLAHHIAWRLDVEPEPPIIDLTCSRLLASEMYTSVVERCIQCQGGTGFTWEQGLQAWYRQALYLRTHAFEPEKLRALVWQGIENGTTGSATR